MLAPRRLAAATALTMILLPACKDATSPDTVDASSLSASLTALTSTFDNSAAFQSMTTLASLFPRYAAIAAVHATVPDPIPQGELQGELPRRAAAARDIMASLSASPLALFPANVLGKTLVWDATSHAYRVDSAATGAPVAGIRILIYTVNTLTGEPVVPLQLLGSLDLTDKSTPQSNKLGVVLALGTTTIADYDITSVNTTTSFSLGAAGYIRNATGTGRVDFSFNNTLTETTFTNASQLTGEDGTQIQAGVTLTATNATITCSVSKGGNTIELAAGGGTTITGTVKYNGFTVATISGSGDPPIFTGANGRQLTAEEVAALTDIFTRAIDVVAELSDLVFRPGDVVFHQ